MRHYIIPSVIGHQFITHDIVQRILPNNNILNLNYENREGIIIIQLKSQTIYKRYKNTYIFVSFNRSTVAGTYGKLSPISYNQSHGRWQIDKSNNVVTQCALEFRLFGDAAAID